MVTDRAARVLVLDGQTTQALACVRSLGRAGHPVFVASHWPRPLGSWSRFCLGRHRLDGEGLTAFTSLRTWAVQQRVTHVFPLTERSCVLCNADRAEWETAGIVVGCGPPEMLQRAFDKAQTIRDAGACGVSIPATRTPESIEECRAAADELGFPLVVKSRSSNAWDGTRFAVQPPPSYVQDFAGLDRVIRVHRHHDQWPLIQKLVPGRGVGVFAVSDRGRPVSWFAHERLRDVRPSGSGSALRRAIPLAPHLQAPAQRLLEHLRWHGPIMFEFRDDGVASPSLIEINGRFWGSLELAVAAGVDFPRLWLEILEERPPRTSAGYRYGTTVRWLWGDVKRMVHILAGPPPGYKGTYPTVWQGVGEVLGRQPPGTRLETWQRDDWRPGVGEWVQGLYELTAQAFGRRFSVRRRRSLPRTPRTLPGLHRKPQ
jgi:predicted ATP-grasp superfamily ATP-dependent carboligase